MDMNAQLPANNDINVNENILVRDGRDLGFMSEYIADVMKKIEQQKMLVKLPSSVKKRVRALRKLQVETTNLDAEFHRMVYDLECKYLEKHNKVFTKRRDILNGDYEPTEEECNYSDPEISSELIQAYSIEEDINTSMNELDLSNLKGIPDFWLNIFKYVPLIGTMIKEVDEPVLKHLIDVRVTTKPLPELSFTLEFHFSPNEYFSDTILTKEYLMKCSADPEDPFSFDGPEIYESRGCEIHWKDGKDLTIKAIKKKQHQDSAAHPKLIKIESFFHYFDPPQIPEEVNDPQFDEINSLLEADFEVGHYIKERIVPRAVLYFTAEAADDLSETNSSSSINQGFDVSEEENNIEEEAIPNEGEGDVANN